MLIDFIMNISLHMLRTCVMYVMSAPYVELNLRWAHTAEETFSDVAVQFIKGTGYTW